MSKLTKTLTALLVFSMLSISGIAFGESPQERLTRVSAELNEVQSELDELTAERDKLNKKIEELQAKVDPLSTAVSEAKEEIEAIAAEKAKAEQERIAAEKAEQERIAAEEAAKAKAAAEEAEKQRLAEEKAEQERIAAQEAKAEQERIAAEKAEAEAEGEESIDEQVKKARAALSQSRMTLRTVINAEDTTLSPADEATLTELGEVRTSTETAVQRFAALETQLVEAQKTDGVTEDDLAPIKASHELAARRLLRLCDMESKKIDEFTTSFTRASRTDAEADSSEDEAASSSDIVDADAEAAQEAAKAKTAAEEAEKLRLAEEKAEQERIAKEKAEADTEAKRIAEAKAAEEEAKAKAAAEEAEKQRLAEEKAEQERIAAQEAKAEAERIAKEKAEAEAEARRIAEAKAAEEAEAKTVSQADIESTIIDRGESKTTAEQSASRESTDDSAVDSSTGNVRLQQKNRVFRRVRSVTRHRTAYTRCGYTYVDKVSTRWQTVKIKSTFTQDCSWSFGYRTYSAGSYCILDNVVYRYQQERVINGQTWPAGFYKA